MKVDIRKTPNSVEAVKTMAGGRWIALKAYKGEVLGIKGPIVIFHSESNTPGGMPQDKTIEFCKAVIEMLEEEPDGRG